VILARGATELVAATSPCGTANLGIGDARQVIEEQQVLRVCVWNPVANAVAHAGGVRFAIGGEHVDTPGGC
jgi:hypothetical protein